MLLFGWSFLEGVGAALILPAIVALVAGNFPAERRPAAYGLVAAAGAVAVAVGPLIGGFCTTYFSWRWVFAGEVVLVLAILLLTRRIADAPVEERPQLDVVGAVLSALGLAMLVFGVLRSGEWGWIQPKAGGPSWAGLSPTIWLVLGGLFVIWVFFRWQARRESVGAEPLVRPAMLRNRQLTGGLTMFFFQYLVQAGFFFVVPLYLSVALGLSAIDTGVRLLPLSVTLLAAAIGIPRLLPERSRHGSSSASACSSLLAGTVVLLGALDADAGPEVVFVPMLLIGLGIGALASQLGAVTVSAVPDDESPEVGGLQNTMTNLGASLGTALAGSLLIAAMTTSFLTNVAQSPAIPPEVKRQAEVELAGGVPFVSDADLKRPSRRCRSNPRPRTRHSTPTRMRESTGSSRPSRSSPCSRPWRCSWHRASRPDRLGRRKARRRSTRPPARSASRYLTSFQTVAAPFRDPLRHATNATTTRPATTSSPSDRISDRIAVRSSLRRSRSASISVRISSTVRSDMAPKRLHRALRLLDRLRRLGR